MLKNYVENMMKKTFLKNKVKDCLMTVYHDAAEAVDLI